MKDFKQTAATQFISSNDKQEVEKKQEQEVDNHKEELATKKESKGRN